MDFSLIKIIEEKRNNLWIKIMKRKFLSTKKAKELLKKYDELLLDIYNKISN